MSYFLHTSYELLFVAQVTSYFLHTSYELLFVARVTSYCLLHELRVTVYCMSYEFLLHTSYELLFTARLTSYFLTMSYNKDNDDKAVYDNKFMIKNYSLQSVFDKRPWAN